MRGVELHDSCFLNFITYREFTDREVFSRAAAFRLVLQCCQLHRHHYITRASCYPRCGSVVEKVEGTCGVLQIFAVSEEFCFLFQALLLVLSCIFDTSACVTRSP